MATKHEMMKSLLSPPGDTIQETIDMMGMSQAELAERMGRPKEKINDIIKGREPVTTSTAFKLARVLGIPAGFWLNREKEYRKQRYEIEQQEILAKDKNWLHEFPVKAMQKLGWLPVRREKYHLVDDMLQFFSIASPEEWNKIYIQSEISVSFRISLANTKNPHAISAWLRKGELQSEELKLNDFDKKKFRESFIHIKELAYSKPADFSNELRNICCECGVALVYTKNLPKAPISGVSRWYRNKPLIQLSGRYKTNDHFWFTFFHEAAHIILHGKKDIFLENLEGAEIDHDKETEANEFAARILLSDSEFQEIIDSASFSEESIRYFSDRFRTPAGVIVGRLQHLRRIPFSVANQLRYKIELFSDIDTDIT